MQELVSCLIFNLLEALSILFFIQKVTEVLEFDLPAVVVPGILPECESFREKPNGPRARRVDRGHQLAGIGQFLEAAKPAIVEIGISSLFVKLLVLLPLAVALEPIDLMVVADRSYSLSDGFPGCDSSREFVVAGKVEDVSVPDPEMVKQAVIELRLVVETHLVQDYLFQNERIAVVSHKEESLLWGDVIGGSVEFSWIK